MNSKRRRPGPPETSVVGRAGSQSCQLIGPSQRGSLGSTSTTSQSKWKPRSCQPEPMRSRTELFAPSQPTAKRARSSRVPPSARRASSSTASAPRRAPDRLTAPLDRHRRQRRATRASRIRSSSGWQNMLDSGQPERLRSVSRPKRISVSPVALRHS